MLYDAVSFFKLAGNYSRSNSLYLTPQSQRGTVGRYLPKHVRADEKLRASFSRSIYVGVSQTFNSALRRLQLSVTQDRPIVSFPLASLSQHYVVVPRAPRLVSCARRPVLTQANFVERLTAALARPTRHPDRYRYGPGTHT